jgi:hypothetical protein
MATPMMPPKQSQSNIISVEKSIGFKWDRGLSRHKGCLNIPVISDLNKALKEAVREYSVLSVGEILDSAELEENASRAFEELGPRSVARHARVRQEHTL